MISSPTEQLSSLIPELILTDLQHYISVDIESAGPNPAQYPLLSIGACSLLKPSETFYIELQPAKFSVQREALDISGLTLEHLQQTGIPALQAMQQFANWISIITPPPSQPVFVAFNAPFDWMFINDYFHLYLGYNPFGHSALDLRTYFMALGGRTWQQSSFTEASRLFLEERALAHHALQDAVDQAELFRSLLIHQYTQKGNKND